MENLQLICFSLIRLSIKDFWCDIINGNLAWPMSPLGSNVTLSLLPPAILFPQGDIGCVTLHDSHHLYIVIHSTEI